MKRPPKALSYYFGLSEMEIEMQLPSEERQIFHQYLSVTVPQNFIAERIKHLGRRYSKKLHYGGSEASEEIYTAVTMGLGTVLYSGIAQMMGVILPDSIELLGMIGFSAGITWLTKKSLTRLLALREVHQQTVRIEKNMLSQLNDASNEFLVQFVHIQVNLLRRVENKQPILQDYVVVPTMVCEVAAVLYRILIDADDLIVAVLCAAIPNLVMLVAAHLMSVKFEIPKIYWEMLREYNSLRNVQDSLLLEDEDNLHADNHFINPVTPRSLGSSADNVLE
jgi:hypothetical protein